MWVGEFNLLYVGHFRVLEGQTFLRTDGSSYYDYAEHT